MFFIPNKYVLKHWPTIVLVYVVARSKDPSEKGDKDRLEFYVEENKQSWSRWRLEEQGENSNHPGNWSSRSLQPH